VYEALNYEDDNWSLIVKTFFSNFLEEDLRSLKAEAQHLKFSLKSVDAVV
jgi:hypothetical protein